MCIDVRTSFKGLLKVKGKMGERVVEAVKWKLEGELGKVGLRGGGGGLVGLSRVKANTSGGHQCSVWGFKGGFLRTRIILG